MKRISWKQLRLRDSAIIFTLAALMRFLYLWEVADSPVLEMLLIDSETYDRFARLILEGAFHGEAVYAMNILYPYFLAAIYRFFSDAHVVVALLQALIDSASCVLVYLLARRYFDRPVALLSAAAAALYGPFIFFSGTLLTPTLINFFVLAALTAVPVSKDRMSGRLMLSGLMVGLATLGRGNSILLIAVILLAFWLHNRGSWRRTLRAAVVFVAAAAMLPGLATLRNYQVEGHLVPIAANYGAFYSGHHAQSTGLYTMLPFVSGGQFENEVLGTRQAVSRKLGREVTLAETSRYLLDEGLRYIAGHPGETLAITLKKFYFFWNRTEPPTNLNYYYAMDYSALLRILPLGMGFIAPLALLGLLLAASRWKFYLLLYGTILVYLLTCVVFYVSAEYRLPAVPFLMMFAAYGLSEYLQLIRQRWQMRKMGVPTVHRRQATRRIVGVTVLLGVAVLFANVRTDLLKRQSLKRIDYLNFGNLYLREGRLDAAEDQLRQSIEIDPHFAPARAALAQVEQLRDGIVLPPSADGRLLEAANRHYYQGEYVAALQSYEQFLAGLNTAEDAELRLRTRNNIGLCHYKMGQLTEAAAIFEALIAEKPDYIKSHNNLGRVHLKRGDLEAAILRFEAALAIDPANRKAREGLAEATALRDQP